VGGYAIPTLLKATSAPGSRACSAAARPSIAWVIFLEPAGRALLFKGGCEHRAADEPAESSNFFQA